MMAGAAKPFEWSDAKGVRREFLRLDPQAVDFAFFLPLMRYWGDRCQGRPAPRRPDIDPLDLPTVLLPHVLLVDVEHEPLDFRYRLAGTAADTIHGRSLKGIRILDMLPQDFARTLFSDLERMAADLQPQFLVLTYTNRENRKRRYRVLRLPLCDEAGRLTMVLVLADHGALLR